ncbi:hypothetical protein B0H14DRAFT_711239 [Mycena olivaceomarginata]|nr:hypothetical protein B0H14DRAFT_711239 [Mycena olivaceomarginata]
MPRTISPLPSWAAMPEPPPSSDEDLVLNDPALFPTQRGKRKKGRTTSQPTSKRAKTTENSNVSSNRTANAVAGPSRRRSPSPQAAAGSNGRSSGPQAASGSKIKTSRYSMSQSAGKPAESVSAARTKPVGGPERRSKGGGAVSRATKCHPRCRRWPRESRVQPSRRPRRRKLVMAPLTGTKMRQRLSIGWLIKRIFLSRAQICAGKEKGQGRTS